MIDERSERETRERLTAAYRPAETAAYLRGLGLHGERKPRTCGRDYCAASACFCCSPPVPWDVAAGETP